MVSLVAEGYIAAVIVIGFSIGFRLHAMLRGTGEAAVRPPSPFRGPLQAWILRESHAQG